jgi:hypothetical protein
MSAPSALRFVLEDSRVLKVGVAIKNDAKLVWQDWGLKIHNVQDIREISGCNLSLRKLSLQFLGKDFP